MIDLKAARQDPDRFRTALARRGAAADFDALLAVDRSWRELTGRAETLRSRQKRSSKSAPSEAEIAELRGLRDELAEAQAELAGVDAERARLLAVVPNLPDPTAADGMAEEDAQTLRTWGERPEFGFTPKDAADLGSPSGWIDMARSPASTGGSTGRKPWPASTSSANRYSAISASATSPIR